MAKGLKLTEKKFQQCARIYQECRVRIMIEEKVDRVIEPDPETLHKRKLRRDAILTGCAVALQVAAFGIVISPEATDRLAEWLVAWRDLPYLYARAHLRDALEAARKEG